MPLYEYRCERCGKQFEVMQKFSDAPLTHHEACGGHVERLLSAPALQFKGSGWYITDYARGGTSTKSNGGDKSGADKSGGETKTTETKTAETKSESKSDTSSSSKPKGKDTQS